MDVNKNKWKRLHTEKRYRPKYPSEQVVQFVFRNFCRNGEEKILDLGCGAGRHVFFMGKENILPYGIDFSEEGVEYTKGLLNEFAMEQYVGNVKVGSLTEIPFEDNYFDGIICYGVLYYLPKTEIIKAVQEMKRVLKIGGKFLVQVRSKDDYRCQSSSCKSTDEKNTYIIDENDETKCANSENGMLMHFFEEDELKELFSEFKDIKIDKTIETHDNQSFCDSNYIVSGERRRDKWF